MLQPRVILRDELFLQQPNFFIDYHALMIKPGLKLGLYWVCISYVVCGMSYVVLCEGEIGFELALIGFELGLFSQIAQFDIFS